MTAAFADKEWMADQVRHDSGFRRCHFPIALPIIS